MIKPACECALLLWYEISHKKIRVKKKYGATLPKYGEAGN